jgi:hypothetical protein
MTSDSSVTKDPERRKWENQRGIHSTAKKLDFPPKAESVIRMSQKKPTNPPPLFKDTDNNTTSKVMLPSWLDLYNKIHYEYFPEFTPHNDPEVRELDDQVFQNISAFFVVYGGGQDTHFSMCWTLRVDHSSCRCREILVK